MADEIDIDTLLDELEDEEVGVKAGAKPSSMKSRINEIKETPKTTTRQLMTFSTYDYTLNDSSFAEVGHPTDTSDAPAPAEPAPALTVENAPDRRPRLMKALEAAESIPVATTAPTASRMRLAPVSGSVQGLKVSPSKAKQKDQVRASAAPP